MRKRDTLAPADAGGAPARRTRVLALGLTVAAHGMLIAALFWPRGAPPKAVPPALAPLEVSLLPAPPAPPTPEKTDTPDFVEPALPRLAPPVVVVARAPASNTSDLLTEAQLAGAAGAGDGGGGGGGCNTAWTVQQALRRDPLVRTAVENAQRLGKAIMIWNGDWVRSGGEDGKGLSAVREAITFAVAFAPEACRNQQVHGLVLLSLADGDTRFAIGSGEWRWSDLLGVRR